MQILLCASNSILFSKVTSHQRQKLSLWLSIRCLSSVNLFANVKLHSLQVIDKFTFSLTSLCLLFMISFEFLNNFELKSLFLEFLTGFVDVFLFETLVVSIDSVKSESLSSSSSFVNVANHLSSG